MQDGRVVERVERLEQILRGLAPARPGEGLEALILELRWLVTVLLGQDSLADLVIRAALEAGIEGTVEQEAIRRPQVTVAAGAQGEIRWQPQPGRVLRVHGALNVIAQPHSEAVTVTLLADQRPVPLAESVPMPADWSLDGYLVPSCREHLTLRVTNGATQSVRVYVDTTLVHLEPVFHDEVVRPALIAQFERLRGLLRRG